MQTFLPYPSFELSAKVLDYRRLNKQKVEVIQILNALNGKTKGWRNHPASLMWKNNIPALMEYFNTMLSEWINRGFNNNLLFFVIDQPIIYPSWLGDEEFHKAHRSNLVRKDKVHYRKYFDIQPDLPYIWPKV
jgi:hypothetical protein